MTGQQDLVQKATSWADEVIRNCTTAYASSVRFRLFVELATVLESQGIRSEPVEEQLTNVNSCEPTIEDDIAWQWYRCALRLRIKTAQKIDKTAGQLALASAFENEAKLTKNGARKECLLKEAIRTFRNAGASRKKTEELQRQLAVAQLENRQHLRKIELGSLDLSRLAANAVAHVAGKSWVEAVLNLATMSSSPSLPAAREHVAELSKKFIARSLISVVTVDEQGHTVAKPGDTIKSQLLEHFAWARRIAVMGTINPARQHLVVEHAGDFYAWADVLLRNPHIDPDRIRSWAKGLEAGLRGDLVVAGPVLVPQVEHFIRQLLEHEGRPTHSLQDDGTQRGNAMGTLLSDERLLAVLGEDFVFDLQALLTEQDGRNLRNLVAHGNLSDPQLCSTDVLYLWHIALRLALVPVAIAHWEMLERRDCGEEKPVKNQGMGNHSYKTKGIDE